MPKQETNFSNYNLRDIASDSQGVYSLGDGLIQEIALAWGFPLGDGSEAQTELPELIRSVGQFKELQDNITDVQKRLGKGDDGLGLAIDWVKRARVLKPLARNYFYGDTSAPTEVERLVTTGGVARWMLRRQAVIKKIAEKGPVVKSRQVHVMTGQRVMKEKEHKYVLELAKKLGHFPTESEFAGEIIVPSIKELGLQALHSVIDSQNGDEIFRAGIQENPKITQSDRLVVVGNAPSTVMTTGQFFLQALAEQPGFNGTGAQLYMRGDSYSLGVTPKEIGTPSRYQNPYTALGQIVRNALILQRSADTLPKL